MSCNCIRFLFFTYESWWSANCSLLALPWRLRKWQPTKHWYVCTIQHGVISQNTGGSVLKFYDWLYRFKSIQLCTFWCFISSNYVRDHYLQCKLTRSKSAWKHSHGIMGETEEYQAHQHGDYEEMGIFLFRVREIKEDDGERKCPRVYWDPLKFQVVKGPLFSSAITKYFIFDSHPYSERRSNRVYTMLRVLRKTSVSSSKHKEYPLFVLQASWRNQHLDSCDTLLQSTLQLRGLTFSRLVTYIYIYIYIYVVPHR